MLDDLVLDRESARRLAVRCQHLAGPPLPATIEGLREVLRALRCLQLDPVNVVARSHLLVLWSRLGAFNRADLGTLLEDERWLFEYWAHAASIVLTEDYPIHSAMMRRYPMDVSSEGRRILAWLEGNGELRAHILRRLREAGPLPTAAFEDRAAIAWQSGGWTSGRNVDRMLDLLWTQGTIMVTRRDGRGRVWDLSERCLPDWADRGQLADTEVVTRAAEHALRSLGIAREGDIERHFTRSRYPGLGAVLGALCQSGRVVRARVEGGTEPWFAHRDVLPLLDAPWSPRTALLSPFDNLICHRERTERLWDFTFRNEMYVPKHKRKYGPYTMPILAGDRLVGRIAPRLDRRRGVLEITGAYAEAAAPEDETAAESVAQRIRELASFTGAREIYLAGPVWQPWRKAIDAIAGSVAPARGTQVSEIMTPGLRVRRAAHPAALCASAVVLGVLGAGYGPLPALGRALDPGQGVWTSAAGGSCRVRRRLSIPGLEHPVSVPSPPRAFPPSGPPTTAICIWPRAMWRRASG